LHKRIVIAVLAVFFLASTLTPLFKIEPARAGGTIYIRADGTVDPPAAPIQTIDNITYSVTADINESIVVERGGIILDGAGHTVSGDGSGNGIVLSATTNVTVANLEIREFWEGITSALFSSSSHNRIVNNTIVENGDTGIELYSSSYYEIRGNNVSASTVQDGIWLYDCHENLITENDISMNTRDGIRFASYSTNNLVTENNITGNQNTGVYFDSSSNSVFHNNFENNAKQVAGATYANVGDDGYPSGGNYWNDYIGTDLYRGSYQNETGSDGIGDTPYVIDSVNFDRYPFLQPNGWLSNFTEITFSLLPEPVYVGQTVTMLGNLSDRVGNPINNTKINVYVNGSFAGALLTNSSGWFTASSKVYVAGTYNVTAVCNVPNYDKSSHMETLTVSAKLDTKVSFTLSPNPVKAGQWVLMSGNLTDVYNSLIGNAPLELYVKIGAGPWQYVGKISTDSSGRIWVFGKVNSVGTYQVAVLYRGSFKHNLCYHIEPLIVNP
jgi:parallel beta-helix repeat protein